MAESRLQRWSRKKTGASKEPEQSPAPTVEPEVTAEEQELAINETLSEQEVMAKYGLPDPNAIELGTDITGFLRKEIPEFMRRKALRGLWRSNPVLAVLDGLNDYDEDYTAAATAGQTVKTLYKVGQGMFDKAAKAQERAESEAREQAATAQESLAPAEVVEPVEPSEAAERVQIEKPEPSVVAEPIGSAREVEPAFTETEAEPTPRYRPRMRFDS